VTTRTDGDRLELTVRDSGAGFDLARAGGEDGEGRGLSITRRRLENLYGDRFSIVQRNLEPTGCEVRIAIPRGTAGAVARANHE